MRLHYMGKYDLDPESLPKREHPPGAVPFREAKDTKTLSVFANLAALALMVVFGLLAFFRAKDEILEGSWQLLAGCWLSLLTLFPHELLHAVCFREDVYLYTNLKQGMLFVVGTEDMSRARFVFLSLLPNLVFGFLPYAIGMLFPQCVLLLALGTLAIGMGAGDYYNALNALTQMPKGARTYLSGFNSFWYLPEEKR